MEFNDTLGRLFGVTHQLFLKNLNIAFIKEELPITAEQFKMMSRLWDQDGISQQTLAEGIGRNRAATGRMVDTLEKKGLIVRKNHPTDRRLNLIFLTQKGKRMQPKAEKCATQVLDQSVKDFSPESIEQLKAVIKKIIRNLS